MLDDILKRMNEISEMKFGADKVREMKKLVDQAEKVALQNPSLDPILLNAIRKFNETYEEYMEEMMKWN